MSGEALARLADAAHVSLRWLLTGEGSPDDIDSVQTEERYGPRRVAVTQARQEGIVGEKVIAQVQALNDETFRFYTAPQWSELMLKLQIAETRKDPQQFYALMAKAKEKAENEAKAQALEDARRLAEEASKRPQPPKRRATGGGK